MSKKPMGLFHTPKDWNELIDWINRHSKDTRPSLMTAAVQGWNMALTPEEEKKED